MTGLAIAGSDSQAGGDAPRDVIEPVTTAVIVATIRTVIDATPPVLD